ncbi:MAG: dual specificity protein phosphatase family protein [Thermodesulfovibrionales bacterium]
MSKYQIRWITDQLAVGPAPLSEEDLDVLKRHGISAIVNLCGEFCDLAEIERLCGFEVYYLAIDDDSVPALEEMEQALEWLDEAIFLGKKILVHCRLGLGRTGTFINSYLLRKGFGLKMAQKRLKDIKSTPSSYYQWSLLKKYDKQNKRLTIREPSLEGKNLVNLTPFFNEYEVYVNEIERTIKENISTPLKSCGITCIDCCYEQFTLTLIESAYINHIINKMLTREQRVGVIQKACEMRTRLLESENTPYECPLLENNTCIISGHRPLRCRVYYAKKIITPTRDAEFTNKTEEIACSRINDTAIDDSLHEISRQLYLALNSTFLKDRDLRFSMINVVSGRFVQDYFNYAISRT